VTREMRLADAVATPVPADRPGGQTDTAEPCPRDTVTGPRSAAPRGGGPLVEAEAARSLLRAVLFGGRPVPRWHERAACASMPSSLFFPDGEGTHRARVALRTAKRVCAGCAVRDRCLADVMAYESPTRRYGVVGGLSAVERHRRGRRRGAEPAAVPSSSGLP
jgi:WhiB family redox-sensing transcriptional regulator